MLADGLVDELLLTVFPFTFGRGQRIFDGMDPTSLKLLEARTFSSGALALRYQPVTRS
jgi:dihydrofolate reductase